VAQWGPGLQLRPAMVRLTRHGRDSTRRFSRAAQEGGGREEVASSATILENTWRSGGRLKQRQQ
jgi:hypothetical protein